MPLEKTENVKKQLLRNNEYYNTQNLQDKLYQKSKNGFIFNNLISEIVNPNNILLAYRNIKNNKGAETSGVNDCTIADIKTKELAEWINYIQERFKNYIPHKVRRVEIEKPGGGIRPLGIPTIEDRLIQQSIKQIIEPIAEAKFYHGSFGFRPDRSAENAIAKVMHLVNLNKLHYAVDIDIKGFFDNVDHGKLLKQMWTMGIRDKKLLSIISVMLKAEIENVGKPTKGVPQGGVLSTILSNIVLNELDWWIHSQWEGVKTRTNYKSNSGKNRELKKSTNLKEVYIVRYADDFKLMCRDMESAQKIYVAVVKWLKDRLGLDVNVEKSKVVNLRKNHSDFLGFKMKVRTKGKKKVIRSNISSKARRKIKENYRAQIDEIKKKPTAKNVLKLNSMILGWQNYYSIATMVSKNLGQIHFLGRKRLLNRTKSIRGDTLYETKTYTKFYGRYRFKPISICKITIFPLAAVKFRIPKLLKHNASRYTVTGRNNLHKLLPKELAESIKYILKNPIKEESLEFNDNRISSYVGQLGRCYISNEIVAMETMITRRIHPQNSGGNDAYNNIIIVDKENNELIEEPSVELVLKKIKGLKFDKKSLKRLNKLRKFNGNSLIEIN